MDPETLHGNPKLNEWKEIVIENVPRDLPNASCNRFDTTLVPVDKVGNLNHLLLFLSFISFSSTNSLYRRKLAGLASFVLPPYVCGLSALVNNSLTRGILSSNVT